MKIIQKCKKMLLMAIMCLVLSAGTVPAMNAYAETVQTETVQADAQNASYTWTNFFQKVRNSCCSDMGILLFHVGTV